MGAAGSCVCPSLGGALAGAPRTMLRTVSPAHAAHLVLSPAGMVTSAFLESSFVMGFWIAWTILMRRAVSSASLLCVCVFGPAVCIRVRQLASWGHFWFPTRITYIS